MLRTIVGMALGSWILPLLWILVVPVLTVPLTHLAWIDLVGSGACARLGSTGRSIASQTLWGCPLDRGLVALGPGILNLVPALWLVSYRPRVRAAAITASVLGAIRLIVPAANYAAVTLHGAANITQGFTGTFPLGAAGGAVSGASLLLWLLSALAVPVFAWSTKSLDSRAG